MIYSMTGFGGAKHSSSTIEIKVEMKSVNSKQMDCSLKLSHQLRSKENEIKAFIQNSLIRGKVDALIHIEHKGPINDPMINRTIFKTYYHELKSICDELSIKDDHIVSNVLRHPEIFQYNASTLSEEHWDLVLKTINAATEELKSFRAQEGQSLAKDLLKRIEQIQENKKAIEAIDGNRLDQKREKIKQKLLELVGYEQIDQARLEQEILYYSEKLDITEELVRLETHSVFFIETIKSQVEEKGKKLNFITQEIGREINTIGSKANDASIQKLIVHCKEELERLKEQINNIL